MSTIEERTAYLNNPFFIKHSYGDFTPFYVTIAICTIIGISLILLNLICSCCSIYSDYWLDRFTGNRWLVTIWTALPNKQPALDLTELKSAEEIYKDIKQHHIIDIEPGEFIQPERHQRPPRPEYSRALLKEAHKQEQLELEKRESDI